MKNMNLIRKTILNILILVLICTMLPVKSNAGTIDDIMGGAKNFLTQGTGAQEVTINSDSIKSASDTIYNILLGVGILIALVVGAILGIHFMMASAEDKAKVKEALIPYIIGCIVIFGAFGIWKIAVTLGKNF